VLREKQVAVGETPNLAARLQSLAAPDTVLVAASTRRLLGGVFVCDDLGPRELKGIPRPVLVWQDRHVDRVFGKYGAILTKRQSF
jgi:class 3 adenylate cyclase